MAAYPSAGIACRERTDIDHAICERVVHEAWCDNKGNTSLCRKAAGCSHLKDGTMINLKKDISTRVLQMSIMTEQKCL